MPAKPQVRPALVPPVAPPVTDDAKPKKSKIADQQLKLREQLWPGLEDKHLYSGGKRTGFTIIPRTMPLMLEIMDALSNGKPVSSVYLEMWCRSFNHSIVVLNKQHEMAFHSGFSGERAVQTWTTRVRILEKLRFIETKPGASGELSYALIWNPYLIIKHHHAAKTLGITESHYNALVSRAIDVGAKDLD